MILSFDTIKYIDFYLILQFVQVVQTIGPNGQRHVQWLATVFKPLWHVFLPKLSDGDFPVIPLDVLLKVDLQTLITTKVFIILRFSYHL
jgi:hypothetical protein